MGLNQTAGRILCYTLAILSGSVVSAKAQTVYTSESAFDAAVSPPTLYNFEGFSASNSFVEDSSVHVPGLTFNLTPNASDPNVYILGSNALGGGYSLNGTADLMAGDVSQFGPAPDPTFAITYDQLVTAAGSEIGFREGSSSNPFDKFSVELFNGVTQVGSTYTAPSAINTGFIGFVTTQPFNTIVFAPTPDVANAYMVYDNLAFGAQFQTGTPEPGTTACACSMLITASVFLRRRRRA